ncbi:MAG: helix-turn-helix domain-containing protein [Euryarchaeota archaeon]|nr:helix-turn-helix domain-containing protein [Euryarchaeota archaeon]
MGPDPLELENRRAIYQLVSKFPGIHLRAVQKRLGLQMGVLEYHLNYMEKESILASQTDGYRKLYFVREAVSHPDKASLSLMRQEILRRIVMLILLKEKASFKDIMDEFKLSKSTISFHLKKLTEGNVLATEKSGRETIYSVIDPEKTAQLIITYKESFLDSVVDRFADAWLGI